MANLILVGVDGVDTSMLAGRRAAELAVALKSKLFVLTAFRGDGSENPTSKSPGLSTAGQARDVINQANAKMREYAAQAESIANHAADELRSIAPHVEAGILYGDAGEAILTEAKRLGANLIVMGNRNMQGFRRILGSVPNMVSHNAPCDVYIVKTV